MGQGSSCRRHRRRRGECILPDLLKRLLELTDHFFSNGDPKQAMVLAVMAWHSFPSFREAQRAHAAMVVHLVAADLGLAPDADHHFVQVIGARSFLQSNTRDEASRKEVRDLLDPAKSLAHSAAADAAHQLIVQHKLLDSLLV